MGTAIGKLGMPVALAAFGIALGVLLAGTPRAMAQRGGGRGVGGGTTGVFKGHITPNWFSNNTKFWYRNDLPGGAREFIWWMPIRPHAILPLIMRNWRRRWRMRPRPRWRPTGCRSMQLNLSMAIRRCGSP